MLVLVSPSVFSLSKDDKRREEGQGSVTSRGGRDWCAAARRQLCSGAWAERQGLPRRWIAALQGLSEHTHLQASALLRLASFDWAHGEPLGPRELVGLGALLLFAPRCARVDLSGGFHRCLLVT